MQLLFHGPNDSNECRRAVRRLAKQLGGKSHYNSFFDKRRGWFSASTCGKAAYSVRISDEVIGSRRQLACLVRQLRGSQLTQDLRFVFAHHSYFEGPLAKPGFKIVHLD